MNSFSPRKWREDDLPLIAELEKKCFSDPWSEEMLAQTYFNPLFHGYLVEQFGCVAAYIGYQIFDDCELMLVATDCQYRNQGFASALIQIMFDECRSLGVRRVILEVRTKNVTAQKLYNSLGFKEITVRKKYYLNGEDAIVMEKLLSV